MNTSGKYPKNNRAGFRLNLARLCAALLLSVLGWPGPICLAQSAEAEAPGEQVLTRGPVHEAFAEVVSYNPQPGIVVTKAPPEMIEEVPPDEKPEGDNVTWIPGYWAWDDERSDYLWVSGIWRSLPPGREWIAGYWNQTPQGYQWISGYWSDVDTTEANYLPEPPAALEEGPNVAAPSPDYNWTPGCWIWTDGRYAWRPGYWAVGRPDWEWVPAHYVWSPLGFVFVEGYWDYPSERRGILFAPVFFEAGVYSRHGYRYSPRVVIDPSVFVDDLFLRPRYCHYYFGDYYGPNYQQSGIYASFSFQSGHYGYDPFYSHQRWVHRSDRDWERRTAAAFQYRREHEDARPPRTWEAQRKIEARTTVSVQNRVTVAVTINQLAQRKDSPVHLQPVARAERQQFAERGRELQKSREQRRTLEVRTAGPVVRAPGAAATPARVQLPRSPIVAKPVSKLRRDQAPPKIQQAPKASPRVQPKTETRGVQANPEKSPPLSQPRRNEPEKTSPAQTQATTRERQIQLEREQQAREGAARSAQEQARQKQNEVEQRARQESAQHAQAQAEAAKKAQEAQQNAREHARQVQQETEQRAKETQLRALEQSRQNAKEQEQRTQQESERRAQAEAARNEAARRAAEAQRKVAEPERKVVRTPAEAEQPRPTVGPQREQVRPAKKEPAPTKREIPNPPRKEDEKKDDDKKSGSSGG